MNKKTLAELFADLSYITVSLVILVFTTVITGALFLTPGGLPGVLARICLIINPQDFASAYATLSVALVIMAQLLTITIMAAMRPWLFARAAWGFYDPRTDGDDPDAWRAAWREHLAHQGEQP